MHSGMPCPLPPPMDESRKRKGMTRNNIGKGLKRLCPLGAPALTYSFLPPELQTFPSYCFNGDTARFTAGAVSDSRF
jgi:hypothetical protein